MNALDNSNSHANPNKKRRVTRITSGMVIRARGAAKIFPGPIIAIFPAIVNHPMANLGCNF